MNVKNAADIGRKNDTRGIVAWLEPREYQKEPRWTNLHPTKIAAIHELYLAFVYLAEKESNKKRKKETIMEEDSKLENVLRNGSLIVGIVLLLGSIYLSYDGFDQKVSGSNADYTILAVIIGYALAISVSLLEFIVSSKLEGLNTTLKILGVLAYAYSIYTNYLGARDLMHMEVGMAVIVAMFMDIVPEPLIAWGLGEAVMHDLFKNLGSIATSSHSGKKKNNQQNQQNQQKQQNYQNDHGNQQRQQQQTRPQQQYQSQYRSGMGQGMSEGEARSVIEQLRRNGGKK